MPTETGCRSAGIASGTVNGVKAKGGTSAGGRGGTGLRGAGTGRGGVAGVRGAGTGLGTEAVGRGGLGTDGVGRGGACCTAEAAPEAVAAINPRVFKDFRRLVNDCLGGDFGVPAFL